jgi:hypothetical protein
MYTFAALALLCAIPDEPAKAPLKADTVPADLTGIYAVTGTDEQGQVYGGSVLIHKAGAGYVVLWSTVLRTDEGLPSPPSREPACSKATSSRSVGATASGMASRSTPSAKSDWPASGRNRRPWGIATGKP